MWSSLPILLSLRKPNSSHCGSSETRPVWRPPLDPQSGEGLSRAGSLSCSPPQPRVEVSWLLALAPHSASVAVLGLRCHQQWIMMKPQVWRGWVMLLQLSMGRKDSKLEDQL